MLFEFLEPVRKEDVLEVHKTWSNFQLGTQVYFNTDNQETEQKFALAILGVEEDRGSMENHGCGKGTYNIRKELYQLFIHFDVPAIIDLGNIKSGHGLKDSQIALQEVLADLLDKGMACIIIGGSHDMTFGQFKAYQNRIHDIDLVLIDEKIDINESNEINARSFLRHIVTHQPNFLFTATHMAHQIFYNPPQNVDVMEEMGFDVYRFGEMKKDIFEMEPYMRNADMLSFDLSAIKSSDAPANALTSPNGLTGEEACQLCRFAGFSNKISSFGLYEFNPYFDQNKQGAKQAAQMLWYFIEGFTHRNTDDSPSENNKNFVKYIVKLHSADYELVFWKSLYSNKWWMEIPQANLSHSKYMPCSYKEYENAMKDELPDKWMKLYKRLN